MRTAFMQRKRAAIIVLCLLAAIAVGVCTPRVLADDACPNYGTITALRLAVQGDGKPAYVSSAQQAIDVLNAWQMADGYDDWWDTAVNAPPDRSIARLDVTTETGGWIAFIYSSDTDPDLLYPAFWTTTRLQDERNIHPLCWLSMARGNLDALVAAMGG